MAIVVESSATTAWQSATTLTITKPTGLAVGDILFAMISTGSGATVSTPSGWTQIRSDAVAGATGNTRSTFLYTIADSADVAASNFAFTISGSARNAGGLLRISGAGESWQGSVNTQQNDGTTTPLTVGTLTPERTGSLIILAVTGGEFTGAASNYSGYTIATNDPSWTEQWELDDGTDDFSCAIATAVRTEVTATGTGSITLASSGSANDYVITMLTLTPEQNQSDTPTSYGAHFVIPERALPVGSTYTVPTPTENSYNKTAWDNEAKPSDTSWVNEDK